MVAAGVAIAASLLAMLVAERLDSAAPAPSQVERDHPIAARGCRGCALASEAGDNFLRKHLERECAA